MYFGSWGFRLRFDNKKLQNPIRWQMSTTGIMSESTLFSLLSDVVLTNQRPVFRSSTNQSLVFTLFAVESLVMSPCIWMTPGRGAMACRSTATIFTSSLSSSGRWNCQAQVQVKRKSELSDRLRNSWIVRSVQEVLQEALEDRLQDRLQGILLECQKLKRLLQIYGAWHWCESMLVVTVITIPFTSFYHFIQVFCQDLFSCFPCCRIKVRNQFTKRWQGFDEEQNGGRRRCI